MAPERGDVFWGPTLHKGSAAYRPWLVVSDRAHPFHDEECIALAMTTRRHDAGIAVPDDAWLRGGSDADAYVSPWYVTTLKYEDLDRQQGALRDPLVEEAVSDLHGYTTTA